LPPRRRPPFRPPQDFWSRSWAFRLLALVTLLFSSARGDPGPAVPVVRILPVDDAAELGTVPGTFRIERDAPLDRALTVRYHVGGTARNGQDYAFVRGEVTLPVGASSAEILITPVDDHVEEEDETARVELLPADAPFELVVLPDTQYYSAETFGGRGAMFTAQTRWVVETREENNIVLVLHEGDVTDRNTDPEWQRARLSLSLLDGVVPYVVAVGNHDGLVGPVAHTERFNAAFPVANFQNRPGFGGVFEPGRMDNVWWTFEAGGLQWLVLSLEFGPRDVVLEWANRVVAEHPDRRAIVVTHAQLYADDTWIGSNPDHLWQPTSYGRQNNGPDLWNKFLRHHPNLALVFSGHVLFEGTGRRVDVADPGNRIYQMLADFQTRPAGGAGYLRRVRFYPAEDRFDVRTYSPYLDQWLDDPENRFEYRNLDWFSADPASYRIAPDAAIATLTIANNDLDPAPPRLVRVVYGGAHPQLRLVFDRNLDPASAEMASNYGFHNVTQPTVLTPVAARLLTDRRTVAIDPAGDLIPHQTYQIAIANLKGTRGVGVLDTPDASGFVYEPSLLHTDFALDGLAGWRVQDAGQFGGPSEWLVRDGQVLQLSEIAGPAAASTDHRAGTMLVYDDPDASTWTNYTVTASFNASDDDGVGLILRYRDRSNYLKLDLDRQRLFRKIFLVRDGIETTLASEAAGFDLLTDQTLRVEVDGDRVVAFLNQVPLFGGAVPIGLISSGTFGLYCWGNSGVVFDAVNATPSDRAPIVRLTQPADGASIALRGDLTVAVAASDPDGEIAKVEVWGDGVSLGSQARPPFEFAWLEIPTGLHSLTAVATDADGRVTRTQPSSFWVVQMGAPRFLESPVSQTVATGDSVLFGARIASAPSPTYRWFFGADVLPDATNSCLFLNNVQPNQAGSYRLEVSSLGATQLSHPAMLAVGPPRSDPVDEDYAVPPRLEPLPAEPLEPRPLRVWAPRGALLNLDFSSDVAHWTTFDTVTNTGVWYGFLAPAPQNSEPQFYRASSRPLKP
jgi:hypothetical protein